MLDIVKLIQRFSHIHYHDKDHYYLDSKSNKILTSSTQYIKKYKIPFDVNYRSKYAALKAAGISVNNDMSTDKIDSLIKNYNLLEESLCIKNKWKLEGKKASEEGSGTHDALQNIAERRYGVFLQYSDNKLKTKHGISFFEDHPHLVPIKTEFVIGDSELGLAGMIDLLIWNTKTDKLEIWDYKTDKEIKRTYYNKMKFPYHNLYDNKIVKYSLQLSIYALILKRAGFDVSSINIIHLKEDGYKIIKLKELKIHYDK